MSNGQLTRWWVRRWESAASSADRQRHRVQRDRDRLAVDVATRDRDRVSDARPRGCPRSSELDLDRAACVGDRVADGAMDLRDAPQASRGRVGCPGARSSSPRAAAACARAVSSAPGCGRRAIRRSSNASRNGRACACSVMAATLLGPVNGLLRSAQRIDRERRRERAVIGERNTFLHRRGQRREARPAPGRRFPATSTSPSPTSTSPRWALGIRSPDARLRARSGTLDTHRC